MSGETLNHSAADLSYMEKKQHQSKRAKEIWDKKPYHLEFANKQSKQQYARKEVVSE